MSSKLVCGVGINSGKYKHQIDERAYQVLLDYQVEIDD